MVDSKFHYMLEQPLKIGVPMSEKSLIHEVNQQVTESELGWLGGIIDGEGSIGINGRENNRINLVANLQLSNSSPLMIQKVIEIMDKLGVKHYIQTHHLSYVNPNHQDVYKIIIGRQSQLKLFLETIIPYLLVKKPQAELVLRYVTKRVNKGASRGDSKKFPYDEEERLIAKQVFDLNRASNHRLRKQESSTTTRETADIS